MTKEEIEKAKAYSKKCEEFHINNEECIPDELENEIFDFVMSLIYDYGWIITADDTHRWVDCDGFYEVEFELNTEIGDIYINTECGGRDLEDEWSKNNPQKVKLEDCYLGNLSWDWCYFLENLYETYEKHQSEE